MSPHPTDLREQDHLRGPAGAPVLLVYGDYECPYTRMAYRTIEGVERRGIPLRLAFRHFPLTQIHPHALHAALAAEAAGRQERFWAMHDLLFHRQKALGDDDLQTYGADLGLDADRFAADRTGPHGLARIDEDLTSGLAAGVSGTPGLFLDGTPLASYDAGDLTAALQEASRRRAP